MPVCSKHILLKASCVICAVMHCLVTLCTYMLKAHSSPHKHKLHISHTSLHLKADLKIHKHDVNVKLCTRIKEQELILQTYLILTSDISICIDCYIGCCNWCTSTNSNIQTALQAEWVCLDQQALTHKALNTVMSIKGNQRGDTTHPHELHTMTPRRCSVQKLSPIFICFCRLPD